MCGACADLRDGRPPISGKNQPPLGVIEAPSEGGSVSPTFVVKGWAGDDRGIRAVRVLIDGELTALASFAWTRPDVTQAYPHFKHGTDRLGFEATVTAAVPGLHVVGVELVDSNGVAVDLGVRRVNVHPR